MYLDDLVSQAHAAIANAVHDKQYRAIPAIISGYTTAAVHMSMAASTLAVVPGHTIQAGSYYGISPTKLVKALPDMEGVKVPDLTICIRPVLNIEEDIDHENIESLILAMPVAIDRMYLNLIRASSEKTSAVDLKHSSSWTYALKGMGVRIDAIHMDAIRDNVSIVRHDYWDLSCRSMGEQEVILIDNKYQGLAGSCSFSPVTPDPVRSSGLSYRLNDGKLELSFSMKASVMICEPKAFTVVEI
jgi:hypothetical protein